jgi:hypothetical protein
MSIPIVIPQKPQLAKYEHLWCVHLTHNQHPITRSHQAKKTTGSYRADNLAVP